jgi:PAS domain S-box-containing protein
MPEASRKQSLTAEERQTRDTGLWKSAARFEGIFRESRAGMLIISLEGRLLAVNPAFYEFLGYSEQEFLGRNVDSITYDEHSARITDALRQLVMDPRKLPPLKSPFRHKDGQPRWVEAIASVVHGSDGQPQYVLAQVINHGDSKQKKSISRNIETDYSQLVNSLNAIVWRANARTFQTLFVSRQAEKILGYPLHHWLDTPNFWIEHLHTEDKERVIAILTLATAEKRNENFEYRMIASDGTIVWLRNTVTVILVNNEPSELLGVSVDVTEFKQIEQNLRESEERLRMATQTGNMFAYEWDIATDKIVRSEGVNQLLGEDEGTYTTGQHILTTVPPEDREKLVAAVAQLSPDRPFLRIKYRMVRSDGAVIWVERNSRSYFDEEGKLLRMVGLIADITDRVRAEEAIAGISRKLIEAQEQERVRIARELHDDIGQRIALLAFGIQRLKANLSVPTDELRKQLEGLEKQTSEIATDVQSLSHELHAAQLEHFGLVAAMRGFCTELAAKQEVRINFSHEHIPPALPQEVSLCLFRIMQEALNNAAKHSGTRYFEVKLRGSAKEISLTVQDFGVGFDPKLARTTQGLGLISMRERVNLVNGTFSITSSPQLGTEVSVRVSLPGGTQTNPAALAGA